MSNFGQQPNVELALSELATNHLAKVVSIDTAHSADLEVMARRLAEIGFLPGEHVRVLHRIPGGEPLAIRVGGSTFALRRHEAACVRVMPIAADPI